MYKSLALTIGFLLLTGLLTGVMPERAAAQTNFDHDSRADFGVFRPSEGNWFTFSSETNSSTTTKWGTDGDVPVQADYDGDGLTDLAVWRPATATWYILGTRERDLRIVNWGATTNVPYGQVIDVPAPADYDGDGHADIAVWRPSNGVWYVLYSGAGFNPKYAGYVSWGKLADIPVQSDYDGDGKADFAVFRYTEQRWFVRSSMTGELLAVNLGRAGIDTLVPADYTGDGKTDIAVYRRGIWIVRDSATAEIYNFFYGLPTDIPVPADYDGDGMTDLGVFRDGVWYIEEIISGESFVFNYGRAGDVPVSSALVKPSIVGVP